MDLVVMTLLLLKILIVGSETFTGCPLFTTSFPSVQNVIVVNNQTAHFSCPENYILDGEPILVCKEDLTWSGKPPNCLYFSFSPLSESMLPPKIHLKDGPGANHGRVQIGIDTTFTLCQDGFDERIARVICTYLGYSMVEKIALNSIFGPSNNRILPVQLSCNGTETNLGECATMPLNKQACDNTKEVALKCRAGAMRLSKPDGYSDEGRFEVFHFGRWNIMKLSDLKAVCRLMGFGYTGFYASFYPRVESPGYYLTGNYDCDETDTSIFECNSASGFVKLQSPSEYHMYSVYCFDDTVSNVRLSNGVKPYSGYLEIEIGQRWKSLCTQSSVQPIAFNACNSTLDERSYLSYTTVDKIDKIPTLTVPLVCNLSLSCSASPRFYLCGREEAVYVECNKTTTVPGIGSILHGKVDYTTISNGTILAKISCNNGFRLNGPSTLSYTNGAWPSNRPTCVINRCPVFSTTFPPVQNVIVENNQTANFSCPENYILDGEPVLVCREDLTWSGEPPTCFDFTFRPLSEYFFLPRIHLKDGPGANHGRVQIGNNTTFSLCQDGFDERIARVICTYLGYSMVEEFTFNSSFGPSNNRVLPVQLSCNGTETNLGECITMPLNKQACDNTKEVALKCKAGAMRLSNPDGYSDEGQFEVFHFRRWNIMQISDIKALCRLMGFGRTGFYASFYSRLDNPGYFLTGNYVCDETDTSVFECNSTSGFFQLRNPSEGHLFSVYCFETTVSNVRLRNGVKPYSGYLEIEIGQRWKSLCTQSSVQPIAFKACSSTLGERSYLSYTTVDKIDKIPTLTVPLVCSLSLSCSANPQFFLCGGEAAVYVECNKTTTVPGIGGILNGQVNYTTFSNGTILARITCDNGFKLSGSSTVYNKIGGWPSKEPSCDIVDCGFLRHIDHGLVVYDTPSNARVANYQCEPQHDLVNGDITRRCLENGTWDGKEPACVKVVTQRYIMYGAVGGGVVILTAAMTAGIVYLRRQSNRRKQTKGMEIYEDAI